MLSVLCIWWTVFIILAVQVAASVHTIDYLDMTVKLVTAIKKYEDTSVPVRDRSLIIYHIGKASPIDSPDVIANNVRMFVSALQSQQIGDIHQSFYIFKVTGGEEFFSSLHEVLPSHLPNVAVIKCEYCDNNLVASMSTIATLGAGIVPKFQMVVSLNHEVRGPLVHRQNGKWLREIGAKFDENKHLGLLGPMISCETAPHVQMYMFVGRGQIMVDVAHGLKSKLPSFEEPHRNTVKEEISVNEMVLGMGYDVASLLEFRSFAAVANSTGTAEPPNICGSSGAAVALKNTNPHSWCHIDVLTAIFVKWGGAPLRLLGFHCDDFIEQIREVTVSISMVEPRAGLVVPETIYGGPFYALYKEYNNEEWLDHTVRETLKMKEAMPSTEKKSAIAKELDSHICLLVRTTAMHGRATVQKSRALDTGLDTLVKCKCLLLKIVALCVCCKNIICVSCST
jgi:hypothetical protein